MKTRKVRLKNGFTLSLAGERWEEKNLLRVHPPHGGPAFLSLTMPGEVGPKVLQGARLHYEAPYSPAELFLTEPSSQGLEAFSLPPQNLSPLEAFRWVAFEGRPFYVVPRRRFSHQEEEAHRQAHEERMRAYLASYASWRDSLSWDALTLAEERAHLRPVHGTFRFMNSSEFLTFEEQVQYATLLQDYAWITHTVALLESDRPFTPSTRPTREEEFASIPVLFTGTYAFLLLLPEHLRRQVPSLSPSQRIRLPHLPLSSSPQAAVHLFTLLLQDAWPSPSQREALLAPFSPLLKEHLKRRWRGSDEDEAFDASGLTSFAFIALNARVNSVGPLGISLLEALLKRVQEGDPVATVCLDGFLEAGGRPIFIPASASRRRHVSAACGEEEYILSKFLEEMTFEEFIPQLHRFIRLQEPLTQEEALQYLSSWREYQEMPASWWRPLLGATA